MWTAMIILHFDLPPQFTYESFYIYLTPLYSLSLIWKAGNRRRWQPIMYSLIPCSRQALGTWVVLRLIRHTPSPLALSIRKRHHGERKRLHILHSTAFLLLSKFRLIVDRFFKGCFNFQGFTRDWWLAFVRHVWSTHNNLIHDKDTMLVSTSIYQTSIYRCYLL